MKNTGKKLHPPHPPPLPLYRDHGGGMNLRVRSRDNIKLHLNFTFESFKMLIFLGIITNKLHY